MSTSTSVFPVWMACRMGGKVMLTAEDLANVCVLSAADANSIRIVLLNTADLTLQSQAHATFRHSRRGGLSIALWTRRIAQMNNLIPTSRRASTVDPTACGLGSCVKMDNLVVRIQIATVGSAITMSVFPARMACAMVRKVASTVEAPHAIHVRTGRLVRATWIAAAECA